MIGSRALFDRMCSIFTSQSAWYSAEGSAVRIKAITNNFTPSLSLALGDLSFATNPQPTVVGGVDTMQTTRDPVSGDFVVSQLTAFEDDTYDFFLRSSGDPDTPTIVYGYAAVSHDSATLLATAKFPEAITFYQNADGVDLGAPSLRFPTTMIS